MLACALLILALLTWGASAYYTLRLNPQVRLIVQGEAIKNAWAEKMDHEHGSKIAAIGGSSCAFSVDGEMMLKKYNLPVVNYGRDGGLGAVMMTEATLPHLRRGDTLIVGFEFGLLDEHPEYSALSLQFCVEAGHPEWALEPILGTGKVGKFELAAALRPGGYHLFTMLGKVISHRDMFRYKLSDYGASGWMQTAVRRPMNGPAGMGSVISPDWVGYLRHLREWCQNHGVRAAYSLPWLYAPPEMAAEQRARNARLLRQIEEIFPVLKDPHLGVDTNAGDYADMQAHLTATAAESRSEELAQAIVHWDVWKTNEMNALASCVPQSPPSTFAHP